MQHLRSKLFCYDTHSNTTITLRQDLSGQTKVALDNMKICTLTQVQSTPDTGSNTLEHAMRNVAQHSKAMESIISARSMKRNFLQTKRYVTARLHVPLLRTALSYLSFI